MNLSSITLRRVDVGAQLREDRKALQSYVTFVRVRDWQFDPLTGLMALLQITQSVTLISRAFLVSSMLAIRGADASEVAIPISSDFRFGLSSLEADTRLGRQFSHRAMGFPINNP